MLKYNEEFEFKFIIVNRLLTVHIWLWFFYFLRWVPQFFNFGIWIKLMAHLLLVLKNKMENCIEKSWSFHSCLYNCIGHWRLTILTTNRAQSIFIQLRLEALQKKLLRLELEVELGLRLFPTTKRWAKTFVRRMFPNVRVFATLPFLAHQQRAHYRKESLICEDDYFACLGKTWSSLPIYP